MGKVKPTRKKRKSITSTHDHDHEHFPHQLSPLLTCATTLLATLILPLAVGVDTPCFPPRLIARSPFPDTLALTGTVLGLLPPLLPTSLPILALASTDFMSPWSRLDKKSFRSCAESAWLVLSSSCKNENCGGGGGLKSQMEDCVVHQMAIKKSCNKQ